VPPPARVAVTPAAAVAVAAAAAAVAPAKEGSPENEQMGQDAAGRSSEDEEEPASKKPRVSHKSHTRRCREKVNEKFQNLLSELPRPPSGTEVKHKAQILDYTIKILRELCNKRISLETELALSSRKNLLQWVGRVVREANSFSDAVEPFLNMYCTKKGWKCSELWQAVEQTCSTGPNAGSKLPATLRLVTTVTNAHLDMTMALDHDLQNFLESSKSWEFGPRMGVPGRVYSTMRPEWLSSLQDPEVFHRASLATASGLSVVLAVPIIVAGKVMGIATFYDTNARSHDEATVDLAVDIATLIGNAYGAILVARAAEAPRRKSSSRASSAS